MAVGPGAPFYQTAHWVDKLSANRQRLCHYLGMRRVLGNSHKKPLPGPNDAVIYFRNYNTSPWSKVFSVWFTFRRLRAPPFVFFERILTQNKFENIWIVAHPCQQKHPIVKEIVKKFGAKVHTGNAEEDFQFISSAQTIIMSPSTYAWWAAFFSSSTTTVHFPIMPGPLPMDNWCELMMRHTENNRKRFVYHDWQVSLAPRIE